MTKSKLALLSVLTVALGAGAVAHARSQGAVLGQARFGSQVGCFFEAEGGPIQSSCSGAPQWVMPIVYDDAGNKTIRISARGTGSGTRNVTCTAFSATSAGALTTGSTARTVFNDGRTEFLQPRVWAHGFGGTWVTCNMEQGTRLFNVHY